MDIRAFVFQMSNLPFLAPLYNTSTSVLGVSALICTVIAYTIAKMFGFGSRKNEFIVEGKVCARHS
jgi:3-dehydrosphinganine reductase